MSKRSKSWLVVACGVLLLAATTTAGVALGSPARSTSSPIEQAAAKGNAAGSAHFSFALTISGVQGLPAGGVTLGGKGGFDTKHKTADFNLDLGSLAAALSAVTGKANAIPKVIEIRTIGKVIYVYLPAFAQTLSPGKKWLKLDLSTLPKTTTRSVNPSTFANLNSQQVLAKLSTSVSVKKLGTSTIGSTSTTHYLAVVDLTKFVDSFVPAAQKAQVEQSLAKAGLKTLPIDFFIGPLGYFRRIAVALSNLKFQPTGPAASLKLSIDFADWGTNISVSPPPAAQTADAGSLLKSLTGATG